MTKLDGINICYFRSGNIKNTGKIKRSVNESLLSYNAWKNYKEYFEKNPHDLIIYYSPSIFWGGLVTRLKSLWNVPSYLILRDIFPQWVIDNGVLKKWSVITKYFRYFEKLNYQAADIIAIQSPKSLEWFEKTVQVDRQLALLYNWAAKKNVVPAKNYYRQKYGLEKKVVYFFGGNIGLAQDMMNIVRLARNMIIENKAHFVLVGEGDQVELLRAAIEDEQLKNMTLLPPVSQDEYRFMLAEFDIGLFTLHKDHTTHNFPGKLLGYMVQEKPILGSINPGNDLKSIVENARAGLVSVNGDDEAFLSNAMKLLKNAELRMSMGVNARKLLHDKFSVESAADKILKFYDEYKGKGTRSLNE